MKIVRTYRFRAYPSKIQREQLARWLPALRALWNAALEQRKLGWNATQPKRFTFAEQNKQLTELRAATPWLESVPRDACTKLLIDLDLAWQRWERGIAKKQPVFKKKHHKTCSVSAPSPKSWWLRGNTAHVPKLGRVAIVAHRTPVGVPKTSMMCLDVDQWFLLAVYEQEIADPSVLVGPVVALDRGIVNLVADSDGNVVVNPRWQQRVGLQLKRLQRTKDRRVKGSARQARAALRWAKKHRQIRRQRDHFIHTLSSHYANNHGVVVLERLQVESMIKVKRFSALIADAGWGLLRNYLKYKLCVRGGTVVEVYPAYSSRTCSSCGHVSADSRTEKDRQRFCCVACGFHANADVNAAKVLKQRAAEVSVPGRGGYPEVVGPMKRQLRVVRRSRNLLGDILESPEKVA